MSITYHLLFSQAFVDSFSRGLAEEVKNSGVTVQCVLPGFVVSKLSKMTRTSLQVPSPETFVKQAIGTVGVETRTGGYSFHKLLVSL